MGLQTRHTLDGRPYRIWVPERMPRLPPDNLACCFFVYPSKAMAERGDAKGGCGFFVAVPYQKRPASCHVYAVTNRHLIDGNPVSGATPTIRVNLCAGGVDYFETQYDEWLGPPGEDFYVRRTAELQSRVHAWRHELIDILVDAQIIADNGIGIGDDVFSIGRFMDHDGRRTGNVPIARFGNIALMPEAEISTRIGEKQAGYLVEMRSRTGFSGSPVYVYTGPGTADFRPKRPPSKPQPGPWVLGLHCAQVNARGPEAEIGEDAPDPPSTSYATAITCVVPAHVIKDFLLNDPRLIAARKEEEDYFEASANFAEPE